MTRLGLSCSFQGLECGLSSCGTQAKLLSGMWNFPGPGIEPMPPALAGIFFTNGPPEEPPNKSFFKKS